MLSKSLVYTMLPAKDLERAKDFYQNKLGLPLKSEEEYGLYFECAQNTGVYVYPSEFAGTNKATAAEWEVSDLAAEMESLRSNGIEFEEYDLPYLKTENGIARFGNLRTAWLKDSEDNILAISQRL